MNPSEPGWDLYRTFLAVIDTGSLSGAARRLGLTQPTVSRHIDLLEAALGRRLFLRSQGGLAPTDDGLAMMCRRPAPWPPRQRRWCGRWRIRRMPSPAPSGSAPAR